jgi:phosphoribosyl-AMP cyclohydrolase / phosphoribosyl-ATP pyrophosphohydrolase
MNDQQLIPAVVQDHRTGEVLMLAYMNRDSLEKTKATGYTWFWSRSRQKLWNKGETSGHRQAVKEIRYDCDDDALVVLVEQIGGGACHTGHRSCFYRRAWPSEADVAGAPPEFAGAIDDILSELDEVIRRRKIDRPGGSYTTELFNEGMDKICAKVEEESAEVIVAAREETEERVAAEAADLVYHLLVLLAERGLGLEQVKAELRSRR